MNAEMIPLDAIDPEAGYQQWVDRFLWHVDQLPYLIVSTGYLALPRLRASRVDQVKVSGGGYVDNVPIADGPGSRDTAAVWVALRSYLTVASSRIGLEAPELPASVPDDLDLARQWAYAANEWLAAVVHEINDWPDLSALEETLFGLIRRARRRQGDTHTVRRTQAELCTVCGQAGVLVDWVDGADGQPVLAKACKVCGQTYTDTAIGRTAS